MYSDFCIKTQTKALSLIDRCPRAGITFWRFSLRGQFSTQTLHKPQWIIILSTLLIPQSDHRFFILRAWSVNRANRENTRTCPQLSGCRRCSHGWERSWVVITPVPLPPQSFLLLSFRITTFLSASGVHYKDIKFKSRRGDKAANWRAWIMTVYSTPVTSLWAVFFINAPQTARFSRLSLTPSVWLALSPLCCCLWLLAQLWTQFSSLHSSTPCQLSLSLSFLDITTSVDVTSQNKTSSLRYYSRDDS